MKRNYLAPEAQAPRAKAEVAGVCVAIDDVTIVWRWFWAGLRTHDWRAVTWVGGVFRWCPDNVDTCCFLIGCCMGWLYSWTRRCVGNTDVTFDCCDDVKMTLREDLFSGADCCRRGRRAWRGAWLNKRTGAGLTRFEGVCRSSFWSLNFRFISL